ncbi:hypothetical protein PFISCL1PPCAC_1535, partial [Pristionchus fissidentatus]
GILGFSTLMAANRHSTFNLGCTCPIQFRPVIYYLIGFVACAICVCVGLLAGMGCTKEYSDQTNAFVDICPMNGASSVIQNILMGIYYVVCLISVSFYVRTYWLIKNQRGYLMKNEKARCGPEIVILKQAIVICGLYLVYIALSTVLPFICNNSAQLFFYVTYSLNVVSLFIAIAFPGLFLWSSTDMKKEISSWLFLCGITTPWLTKAKRISSATTITSRDRTVSLSK